jgi:hypothetical protein
MRVEAALSTLSVETELTLLFAVIIVLAVWILNASRTKPDEARRHQRQKSQSTTTI